jgi:hypothetical protein
MCVIMEITEFKCFDQMVPLLAGGEEDDLGMGNSIDQLVYRLDLMDYCMSLTLVITEFRYLNRMEHL